MKPETTIVNKKKNKKSKSKMQMYIKGEDQGSMTTFVNKKQKQVIEVF